MIITATPLGCEMFAPLDGLSGADAGSTVLPAAEDDASPPASEGGQPETADAADEDAAPAADAADAADAGDASADTGVEAAAGEAGDESAAPAPVAFVQVASSTPAGAVPSVSATFAQAQSPGDLNVVAIGWNDATTAISGVSDTSGNAYALAVGPTRISPDLTQAIYYAKSIAGAAAAGNVVTVAFVNDANVADLRIAEYSGLDTVAPFVAGAAGSANDAGPAASGMVTTTAAPSLLFGAGMTTDIYTAPGAGYDVRTVTPQGDMIEDRIVTTAGSYDAEASLGGSCRWILQVAAFH